MNSDDIDLSPPARLAVAYAPQPVRAAFLLLLRFDARFAGIIGSAKEPLIALMKIAWWRDAIMASVSARPRGEPLLSSLFELDDRLLNQAIVQLADAWELLVGDEQWPRSTLESFAQLRGQAVFQGYAKRSGQKELPAALAGQWALDDLRFRFGDRAADIDWTDLPLPKGRLFRPLTVLAMSVRGVSGPRLIWHALTGR